MLQHLLIARRDRLPVDEIRRVEFNPEGEILGNVLADFGGYPAKKVQLLAVLIRTSIALLVTVRVSIKVQRSRSPFLPSRK